MQAFSTYEKIAESSASWKLDANGFRTLRRVRWAVTEKVHGANFCFLVTPGKVAGASRRRLLTDNEPFYNWQTIRDRWTTAFQQVFDTVTDQAEQAVERVCIYGEIFGGSYPHPDVVPVPNVLPVQTGVWYAPGIQFVAFDVAVESEGSRYYIDFEQMRTVLRESGIPCVAPLFIGNYEQATDFPVRFDSTIPATLGLPSLPSGTNLAEGIIVRPIQEIIVAGGSGPIRPLLKVKLPEFAEDIRFHGAQKWAESAHSLSPGNSLDILKWEAYCRFTANRVDTARSKIGPQPQRNRRIWARELFHLLLNEVRDEARTANETAWLALSPDERHQWDKYVKDELRTLLKTQFPRTL